MWTLIFGAAIGSLVAMISVLFEEKEAASGKLKGKKRGGKCNGWSRLIVK